MVLQAKIEWQCNYGMYEALYLDHFIQVICVSDVIILCADNLPGLSVDTRRN